jgi:hypothetical protein
MEEYVTYAGYVIAAFTALVHLYRAHKAGKTYAEAMLILANTLKDESKMNGGVFSPDTIKKAEEFATTIGANDKAVEEVKTVLKGNHLDVKLGTFRGKAIFLSDALKLGGILNVLKKLTKKG